MKQNGFIDNNLATFACNQDVTFKLMYFFFQNIRLGDYSNTTALPAISLRDLKKRELFYPVDVAEQSKIAEILSTVDEAIDKTRALIEKYKNIKAGMMQDLLSNGIDKDGLIRSPETHGYKDSLLGMIPVEWDCVSLGTICDCITKLAGFEYTKYFNSYNDGGEIVVVRGINITNNEMDLSDVKNIPRKTSEMLPRSQLHKRDLVFAYVGTIGPIWLVDEDDKYHLGPNTAKIKVKSDIDVEYIHQYFTSRLITNEITFHMSVGAQPSLSMTKIRKFRILRPRLKTEQTRIAEMLTTADDRIQTEREYLAKLQDIKLGLMQDLLTNTVSVDALL